MTHQRNRTRADGFILAGGDSARFGRDKAVALYDGEALIDRCLGRLQEIGVSQTIVTPERSRYSDREAAILAKERKGLGPVEGLRVALEKCRQPWALVLAVDMPRVDQSMLSALLRLADDEDRAICFLDSSGRRHPFPGLYKTTLGPLVTRMSEASSMQKLLNHAGARALRVEQIPEIADLDARLMNVNRPEDLSD